MLSSSQTRINLYETLNAGGVVMIDAAGMGDTAPMFGRICIALVLQAVFARYRIEQRYRKPTFLFVDEAQYYFDTSTTKLLTDARKFKLGGVFAHHGLKDLSDDLRSYLMGETGIRMVGRPFPEDLTGLARALHTTPEVLTSQPQYHFTTWIDEVTKKGPVSASVDASIVENADQMDEDAYKFFAKKNRKRVEIIERAQPTSVSDEPPQRPPSLSKIQNPR